MLVNSLESAESLENYQKIKLENQRINSYISGYINQHITLVKQNSVHFRYVIISQNDEIGTSVCYLRTRKGSKLNLSLCEQIEFIDELYLYEARGVSLYIDLQKASPEDVIYAHKVNEEVQYMRDYIYNSKGKVIELYFHRIK